MVQDSVLTANDDFGSSFSYKEVVLQPGLSVGLTSCIKPFTKPACFDGDHGSLHFNYLIDGCFDATLGSREINLRKGSINRGFAAGRPFHIQRCTEFTNLEVIVSPEVFLSLSGEEGYQLEGAIRKGEFFLQECKSCHRSTSAALQITSLLKSSPKQTLLLHSAILEYLYWNLQSFSEKQGVVRISMRERKQLEAARSLLLQNLSKPMTIPQLATEVGLNQFKLKQGFKALFENSIYATFQEERMKYAIQLLQRMNVTETALELGYSNISHFSAAFRKQFGISPREARHDRQVCISSKL